VVFVKQKSHRQNRWARPKPAGPIYSEQTEQVAKTGVSDPGKSRRNAANYKLLIAIVTVTSAISFFGFF